jgi:hypothetical protein
VFSGEPVTSNPSHEPIGIREIFDLTSSIDNVIHLEIGEPNFETPAAEARAQNVGRERVI